MKGLPYSPYITLEGSCFGSNFREVSVGIILNLFWAVFHEYSLKSFTSDTIKLSQKNEFLALRAFRFTLSWRYIIVVSFISIAFVIFKLKVSKILRTDSASTKEPFLGGFWALTPQVWFNVTEILTRGSTLGNKNTEKCLMDSSIYGKRSDPKLAFLVQLWPVFSSWRWPKSKK